jgi:putative endonuclease
MFYVYVLESGSNGSLYYGMTDNLQRRFKEHTQGLNRSTKRYAPWKLIYYEACLNERDAARREKWLKTTQGSRMIRRRIQEYLRNKS